MDLYVCVYIYIFFFMHRLGLRVAGNTSFFLYAGVLSMPFLPLWFARVSYIRKGFLYIYIYIYI